MFYLILREDTHKKSVFLVVGPLRFYPPYTNGLVVHAIIQLVYLLISSELCIDKFALNNLTWLQSTPFSHMPATKNYIYYFKMSFDLYVGIKGITICQKRKLYFSCRWTTYVIILYNTYIWKVLLYTGDFMKKVFTATCALRDR